MTAGISCRCRGCLTAPNSFDSNAVQSKLTSPFHKYITHEFHPVKGKQFDGGNQSSSTRHELTASWCRVKLRSLFVPVPVPVPVSVPVSSRSRYSVLGRAGCTVPTAAPNSHPVGEWVACSCSIYACQRLWLGKSGAGGVRPEGDTNVVLIMLVAVVASSAQCVCMCAKGKTER